MDGQNESPRAPTEPNSDVIVAASFGGSDGDSEYLKSTKNSPLSLANTLDLARNIRKLEIMHKVWVREIIATVWPMVIFSHTNELEITELANAKTDPTKNIQDYGSTTPIRTYPSLPHSTLEDNSVSPAEPPPCPHVESVEASPQAHVGDLPDVQLLGSDDMLFGVY